MTSGIVKNNKPLTALSAVLWDMDGTLIDSEPYWIAAETELVEAHGGVWTHEDGRALAGYPMLGYVQAMQERGVDLLPDQIVDFLKSRVASGIASGIPWQPGARELLERVADAGVLMALVTSSFAVMAEPFVAAVGLFAVVVSGDDVSRPKPDPEPYLLAAERLGVDVATCVAVEDSRIGVASAVDSGAQVLAVEVTQAHAERPGLSRASSLVGLTVSDLTRIARGDVLDRRRVG